VILLLGENSVQLRIFRWQVLGESPLCKTGDPQPRVRRAHACSPKLGAAHGAVNTTHRGLSLMRAGGAGRYAEDVGPGELLVGGVVDSRGEHLVGLPDEAGHGVHADAAVA
jgi:hypothetical protein